MIDARKAEGRRLADRYREVTPLKVSPTLYLYLAADEVTGNAVKVKRVPRCSFDRYVAREAAILTTLDHPRIPRILDRFEEDDHQFLVYTYFEAPTLQQYACDHGTLPMPDLAPLMRSALEVLDYLHTRSVPVIHRDVKPANQIVLDSQTIGLIDFDIASLGLRDKFRVPLGDLTAAYTPGFAPPEQVMGREAFAASDLYALAASFVLVTTGMHPVHLWNARRGKVTVPTGFSRPIRRLLTWMLEPNLVKRCPSAQAALETF